MNYEVTEINNGVAKIQFSDGTWTFVQLTADLSEADLDDIVHNIVPPHLKTGEAPSFLSAGATRTAAAKPAPSSPEIAAYILARQMAYGTPEQQLEYITENGLDAWIAKVAQIKSDNPKP